MHLSLFYHCSSSSCLFFLHLSIFLQPLQLLYFYSREKHRHVVCPGDLMWVDEAREAGIKKYIWWKATLSTHLAILYGNHRFSNKQFLSTCMKRWGHNWRWSKFERDQWSPSFLAPCTTSSWSGGSRKGKVSHTQPLARVHVQMNLYMFAHPLHGLDSNGLWTGTSPQPRCWKPLL